MESELPLLGTKDDVATTTIVQLIDASEQVASEQTSNNDDKAPDNAAITTTNGDNDAPAVKRIQAWTSDRPRLSIFTFYPVQEATTSPVEPIGGPDTSTTGVNGIATTHPGTAALTPAALTPATATVDHLSIPIETLANPRSFEIEVAHQAEKMYVVPTDIADFGFWHCFQLGWSLTYMTLLLRRHISPRLLHYNQEELPPHKRMTRTQCVMLATTGLAFNLSTQELMIRQVTKLKPVKRPRKRKQKWKKRYPKPKRRRRATRWKLRLTHSRAKTTDVDAKPPPTMNDTPVPGNQEVANATGTKTVMLKKMSTMMSVKSMKSIVWHRSQAARSRKGKISSSKIQDDGAVAICRALRVNTALVSLILQDVDLGDRSMCALAAALRANSTLTLLDLSHNRIGPLGAQALSEALEDAPDVMVISLKMSHNEILDQGADYLRHALEENETLTELDVSWNQVSSEALLRLLGSLRENFVFQELSVFGRDRHEDFFLDNIDIKASRDIVKALWKVNPSFANLRLTGSMAVIPVDKVQRSRWVEMAAMEVMELDALVISGLLPLNDKIVELDLSDNPGIKRWGVLDILKRIKHCPTLKLLNLSNTGLYEEVGEEIGELVASNETLETILMHGEHIPVQQARGIDAAQSVPTLSFDIPQDHYFDRWILSKCLALNRPTLMLNKLKLPVVPDTMSTAEKQKNAHLLSINLSGKTLDVYEVVFLSKKIFHHLQLLRAAFNGCKIDSYGGVALADALRNHATLQTLEMENNAIGKQGGKAMTECIQFNHSLTYMNLSWNRIGNDGVRGIELALPLNSCLTRLDLRGNELSASGIVAISKGLRTNACLRELYLRWNTICPQGAQALADALLNNKCLRLLDIEHHTMGEAGARAFAKMLMKNDRLLELNIKGDDIKDDKGKGMGIGSAAAEELAAALCEKNQTLTTLNVAQNNLGKDGVAAFSNVIKFNQALQILDLSLSEMNGKIAERFFECLAMNKTLIKLNLAHNRISNEGMTACAKALDLNKTLHDLNVADNMITEEPLALLVKKLQVRTTSTLRWLCISGNTMTKSTKAAYLALAPMVVVEVEEEEHRGDQAH